MENQIAKIEPTIFEKQMEVAAVFAHSDLVPTHFQKIENAWIALNMADRMGIDPFMLMQNLYIVYGKPGIEGKLVIALVNDSGKFSELEFEISGEGDDFGCVAKAARLSTKKTVSGPRVTVRMAKEQGWWGNKGSKWPSMTDLMIRYRAATFFARVNCPEVLFGMQTKEEIIDSLEVDGGDSEMIGYEPVQKIEQEQEYTLPKAQTEQKQDSGLNPYGDSFPVICGNDACPSYDPKLPDRCGQSKIHRPDGRMASRCSDIIRLGPVPILSEIKGTESGALLIEEIKAKLGMEIADTDEKKWQLVEEILFGE